MSILNTIAGSLQHRERKELFIYFGIFIGLVIFVMGIVFYTQRAALSKIKIQMSQVNKQREEAQKILQKNKIVLAQQQAVKEVIAQNPNFYIREEFEKLLADLSLQKNLTKDLERSESEIENGAYLERKLAATLANLNMKQLCDLLYKIEQNQRLYTKDLKIIKNIKNGLLDVTLIIATLEAQAAS